MDIMDQILKEVPVPSEERPGKGKVEPCPYNGLYL